jgi:uncharacterized protein
MRGGSRSEGEAVTAGYDTGVNQPARPWIDTSEFARRGATLSARQSPADFPRLRELLAGDEGEIAWSLDGERRPRPEGGSDLFMRLGLSGEVWLECTRCLQPVSARIDEQRLFKLALTETQAEREDAQADDYDVLAGSPRFDVLELVEDEAMMALPIAPRHDDCSLPARPAPAAGARSVPPAGDEADRRPNPFSALAGLKRRSDEGLDET